MANFLESNITKLRIGARTEGNYIPGNDSPTLLVEGNVQINTTLLVNGKSTLTGADINGNLLVNGTGVVLGALTVDNLLTLGNGLNITNGNAIVKALSVSGVLDAKTSSSNFKKIYVEKDGSYQDILSIINSQAGNALTSAISSSNSYTDTKVSAEATARSNAVSSARTDLQTAIDNEASARETKDTQLQNQINNITNEERESSLAGRIIKLENRKIDKNNILTSKSTNLGDWSGVWMVCGCDNVTIYYGSSSYTAFCPCFIWGPFVRYHSGSSSPHNSYPSYYTCGVNINGRTLEANGSSYPTISYASDKATFINVSDFFN